MQPAQAVTICIHILLMEAFQKPFKSSRCVDPQEAQAKGMLTLRDQWVQASSIENSTPPMGAPKAACAIPSDNHAGNQMHVLSKLRHSMALPGRRLGEIRTARPAAAPAEMNSRRSASLCSRAAGPGHPSNSPRLHPPCTFGPPGLSLLTVSAAACSDASPKGFPDFRRRCPPTPLGSPSACLDIPPDPSGQLQGPTSPWSWMHLQRLSSHTHGLPSLTVRGAMSSSAAAPLLCPSSASKPFPGCWPQLAPS